MKPARFNSLRGALFALALACALPATHAATLRVDGEVYAQRSSQLITVVGSHVASSTSPTLAPDGSSVKKGDVVVAFDTSDLVRQLSEKQSLLQEKKRTLEKPQPGSGRTRAQPAADHASEASTQGTSQDRTAAGTDRRTGIRQAGSRSAAAPNGSPPWPRSPNAPPPNSASRNCGW